MSNLGELSIRDGKVDLAVVAGPRLRHWPSAGVKELSLLGSNMGLTVGLYGGDGMNVRGVIPLSGTGGIVLVEDVQKRIHRIQCRAVVKITQDSRCPDPFPGSDSSGVIPLATAERLQKESHVQWDPTTVILGTGNEAFRFGSTLLAQGVAHVICLEIDANWGGKRYAGWEVEKRRFEILGGKVLEGRPTDLVRKSPLLWSFRVQDSQGVRHLEVARVVSAGPFRDGKGVREYPLGSALFELEQTASSRREDDLEGWILEEERGRWLAGKVAKALALELGDRKEFLEKKFRKARNRMKHLQRHREEPYLPSYQGKWLSPSDLTTLQQFSGVPKAKHLAQPAPSIECIEQIGCDLCAKACPVGAIQLGKIPRNAPILDESLCTSCGICVQACPSQTISLLHLQEQKTISQIVLPWRGRKPWKVGQSAVAVNRRGDVLGNVRVTGLLELDAIPWKDQKQVQLVQVGVPHHLLWEVRGIRKPKAAATDDEAFLRAIERSESSAEKVEIIVNGERRMVREQISVSLALFEMGQGRSADVLDCPDGSCGLCEIEVDGLKKLACQEKIHRGVAIRNLGEPKVETACPDRVLCSCLGLTIDHVLERIRSGHLKSPEAVLSVTHVGEGKCHGQKCMEAFRRMLLEQEIDASVWVDWRFPWSDWTLGHS